MEDSAPLESDTSAIQGLVRRVIPQWVLLFFVDLIIKSLSLENKKR